MNSTTFGGNFTWSYIVASLHVLPSVFRQSSSQEHLEFAAAQSRGTPQECSSSEGCRTVAHLGISYYRISDAHIAQWALCCRDTWKAMEEGLKGRHKSTQYKKRARTPPDFHHCSGNLGWFWYVSQAVESCSLNHRIITTELLGMMLGVLTTHGLRCWMTGYHLNGYPSLLVPLASGEPSSKKLRWFSLTTECCWVWITREIFMKLVKVPQERNQWNKVAGCIRVLNGLWFWVVPHVFEPNPISFVFSR